MSKSKDPAEKLGRNPLTKLKTRQSSHFLQSTKPVKSHSASRNQVIEKFKELELQIDWVQLYDQAVPRAIKKFAKLFSVKS